MSDLIYHEPQQQLRIDACLPQITAVREGKIDLHALTHGKYPGRVLPDEALSEISSLGFIDARGQQDWGMEDHRNEGIEICLQESGNNTLVANGKKYPLAARMLSITRPWELHRIGDPHLGAGRLHWIIIDVGVRRPNQSWKWPDWCVLTEGDLHELSQLIRTSEHAIWQAEAELIGIFRELATYVTAAEPSANISRLMITINRLLVAVLELLRFQRGTTDSCANPSMSSQTVELFLSELRRSPKMLANPWTLVSMATYCGMGRSAFSKYCYELHNVSPIEYLNSCRLDYAAVRLSTEDIPVTTIAIELGFSSSQYFSRVFKRFFGVSPSEYRKQPRRRRNQP